LDTSTPGVIRLVGQGGIVANNGEIDAGNGVVEIMAGIINLAGQLYANASNLTVGFGADFGVLDLFEIDELQTQSLNINGLGQVNMVYGLANLEITGLNQGTAGLDGVGVTADNWTENGVTFSNIHHFTLTGEVPNTVNVTSDGQLFAQVNGVDVGHIIGGGDDDIFNIDGDVVFLDGGHGDDVLNGVFNPISNLHNGTSDNILSWSNIETVIPGIIVPEPPEASPFDPVPNINVPRNSTNTLTDSSSSSLGLVGSDQSLKLPCAYRDKGEAKDDEDCNEAELEALVSSLIHFDFNSSAITSASQDRLNRVASFILQDDRFDRVVLSGHTDNLGTIAYNLALSARRTTSTAAYLKGQGVAPSLFEIHAFGESLPARSNATGAGRAYNRRVHVELE
jgi:outer membrane protein OmpA-like peptidoglycan-associated protein